MRGTLPFKMIGIVPAAGSATRMQPLGGSKELLPLGQCRQLTGHRGVRLRAISEYLVERMLLAGAERVCFVISGEKADLLRFYAQSEYAGRLFFVVQPQPAGLCDAVFRAVPFVNPAELVLIGLPDTIWYPRHAFAAAPAASIHLITFPVPNPEEFDAVIPASKPSSGQSAAGAVARIEVKSHGSRERRVWGAITAGGREFLQLAALWRERQCQDQYLGHLFNAWIAAGNRISFDRVGTHYWDIGSPNGYLRALKGRVWEEPSAADVSSTPAAA